MPVTLIFRKSGHGEPVIILHGLYGASDNWISIARKLEERFTIFIPDLRNHGHSPHTTSHTYQDMVDDLSQFFNDHHISRAIVLGHSMGGKVAMMFAAEYPELVAGLIVADIAPKSYNLSDRPSSGSELSTGTYYAFGCANCHPTDPALHANGVVDVILTPSTAGGTLKAKNSATAAVTVVTAGSNVTCFGVYCHSNGQATPTFATAPNWYGGAISGDKCAACHGNSPTSGAHMAHAVGLHADDIFNGTFGKYSAAGAVGKSAGHGDPAQSTTLSCNICHNSTISVAYNDKNAACVGCHNGSKAALKGSAVITNRAMHVNGKADLTFYSTAAVKSKAQLRADSFSNYTAAGGYWTRSSYKAGAASVDTAKSVLNNSMYSAGNCSNIACHNGRPVNWTTDVGKGADCVICHSKL